MCRSEPSSQKQRHAEARIQLERLPGLGDRLVVAAGPVERSRQVRVARSRRAGRVHGPARVLQSLRRAGRAATGSRHASFGPAHHWDSARARGETLDRRPPSPSRTRCAPWPARSGRSPARHPVAGPSLPRPFRASAPPRSGSRRRRPRPGTSPRDRNTRARIPDRSQSLG